MSNCANFFLNACFSYFAFKSTHFAQVLDNFAQTCVCTSATFRSSEISHLLAWNRIKVGKIWQWLAVTNASRHDSTVYRVQRTVTYVNVCLWDQSGTIQRPENFIKYPTITIICFILAGLFAPWVFEDFSMDSGSYHINVSGTI